MKLSLKKNTVVFLLSELPNSVHSPVLNEINELVKMEMTVYLACLTRDVCREIGNLSESLNLYKLAMNGNSILPAVSAFFYFMKTNPHATLGGLTRFLIDNLRSGCSLTRGLTMLPRILWVARTISTMPNTVVHSQGAPCSAMACWLISKLTQKPYLLGVDASDVMTANGSLKRSMSEARAIVTRTEFGKSIIKEKFSNGACPKILLMRQGIAFEEYSDLQADKEDVFTILVVLVNESTEDINWFLKICRRLIDSHLDIRFVCMCENHRISRVTTLIYDNSLEHTVSCMGYPNRTEFQNQLKRSHVMIRLSYSDGVKKGDFICSWILQSMAMQVPVIATTETVIQEAVNDFVSGMLIAQDDQISLSSAIHTLYYNPQICRLLGLRARQLVMSKFNLGRNMMVWEKVYQAIRA